MSDGEPRGPVVIAGLGGSGTRVVARAFERLGVHMGWHLNRSHDNLLLTLLIKRPQWLPQRLSGDRPSPDVIEHLKILRALMLAKPALSEQEMLLLGRAASEMAAWGSDHQGSMRGATGFRIAADALEAGPPTTEWWGWKAPNTHLVLPELIEVFPELRYVHVVRHPLDMAFSGNRTQATVWGPTVGIEIEEGAEATPEAQLRWWLLSTKSACEIGKRIGDRFLMLDFDRLCADPARAIKEFAGWLGHKPSRATIRDAISDVKVPDSAGRWRSHDWQNLNPSLLSEARSYGFYVPPSSR